MLSEFGRLVKKANLKKIAIICGALGIGLIFLSSLGDLSPKQSENVSPGTAEYRDEITASLKSMLESIEGVGEANVLLTVESSAEGVYVGNSPTKSKEIEPVIRGVVVSCEGGDDPVIVMRVTQAVTKALDVSSAKVYVAKSSE